MGAPIIHDFQTSDPELAAEVLSAMYVDNRLRVGSGPVSFSIDLRSAAAGPVHVGRMRFSRAFSVAADPVAELLVVAPLTGAMVLRSRHEIRLNAATPGMVPRGVEFELQLSADFSELVVPLPMAVVADRAATIAGDDAAAVRFTGVEATDRQRARAWMATVTFVERSLRAPGSLLCSPLLQAEAVGLMAAQALETFPNTAMTARRPSGVGWVSSTLVRRAAAFMDEHADQPLTVGTIAAAVGVGPRALQHAFRRHLATTPLAHLRQLRLIRAHEQLSNIDPAGGTTVRDVAATWGFSDLHRFTIAYRTRYGHHPKTTLAADPG